MSQPARRMNAALSATLALIASGALHALLVLGLIRSASGAERTWDELAPARFVGNTFDVDMVEDTALAAAEAPAPPPPPAPAANPAAPSEPAAPAKPPPAPVVPAPVEPAPPLEAEPPVSKLLHREPALPTPAPPAPAPPPSPSARMAESRPLPGYKALPHEPVEASSAAQPAASAAPAYGQAALPANTASFAKAFTRAVPQIASRDKVWHGLSIGAAGNAVFDIEVDAQGKVIGKGTVLDEPAPAAHLSRIIGRTILLMKNQTFALSSAGVAAGKQRFELSAQIVQEKPLESSVAEPEDLMQMGRPVEPTPVRPGKADFTYNSGRHVVLSVRLLNP